MKQRTISAIILMLILISCLAISSKLFGLLMIIIAILGFNEFFDIKYDKKKELKVVRWLGIISLILLMLNRSLYNVDTMAVILLPLFLLTMPIIFYNDNKLYNINDCLYIVGIIYFLGLSFGNIIILRNEKILMCIFIFIISFITDTYAYIGGNLIGKHKLTTISPKKTIEGSLIGIFFGVMVGSVYYFNMIGDLTKFRTIVLCLVLSIVSEMGDLLFSSIKRNFDKKDYSNLIPGHGGILDRFDSVIYVSLVLSLIGSLM